MKLPELIKKHGFDEVNKDIMLGIAKFSDKSFRVKSSRDYNLFSILNNKTSLAEVYELLNTHGHSPATIHELLMWDDWDGKSTVVAAGSTATLDSKEYVPCFSLDHFKEPDKYYSMKRLCLLDTSRPWKGQMFFLGIKKSD